MTAKKPTAPVTSINIPIPFPMLQKLRDLAKQPQLDGHEARAALGIDSLFSRKDLDDAYDYFQSDEFKRLYRPTRLRPLIVAVYILELVKQGFDPRPKFGVRARRGRAPALSNRDKLIHDYHTLLKLQHPRKSEKEHLGQMEKVTGLNFESLRKILGPTDPILYAGTSGAVRTSDEVPLKEIERVISLAMRATSPRGKKRAE